MFFAIRLYRVRLKYFSLYALVASKAITAAAAKYDQDNYPAAVPAAEAANTAKAVIAATAAKQQNDNYKAETVITAEASEAFASHAMSSLKYTDFPLIKGLVYIT